MAKVKLKLNGAAIKGFFSTHGEKVGLGVALLVTCFLVIKAMSQPTLPADKSPDQLGRRANEIEQHIREGVIPPPEPSKYDTQRLTSVVEVGAYKQPALPNPPPRAELDRRKQPRVFTLDKDAGIDAFGDRAKFEIKGVGAGAQVNQARYFVMFTGLVPVAKQQAEFDEVFKGAVQPPAAPNRDFYHPKYYIYEIRRREVLPGGKFGPETEVPWKPIWSDMRQVWTAKAAEVAPKEFVDDRLTFPLAKRLDKPWDNRVVHPTLLKPAAAGPADKPADKKADAPEDVLGGGEAKAAAAVPAGGMGPADKGPPFKMFRFWDYAVEPGKSYQYSVRLILENPNFELPQRFLDNPTLAVEKYLNSEWSEWSKTASVPPDHALYVKGTTWDANNKETVATVLCVSWNPAEAVELNKEFKLYRGEVAVFDVSGFIYKPRFLLLDIRGGQIAPNKNAGPAEMTFMDPATGRMFVRREEDDQEIVSSYAPPPAAPADAAGPAAPAPMAAPPIPGITLPGMVPITGAPATPMIGTPAPVPGTTPPNPLLPGMGTATPPGKTPPTKTAPRSGMTRGAATMGAGGGAGKGVTIPGSN